MTDGYQQQLPFPQSSSAFAPEPKKSNKKLWIIVSVAASLLCVCVCLCIAIVALVIRQFAVEREPVREVLDAYMQHMAAKEVERAYALLSPRAQRQIPISKLQDLINTDDYVIYAGYRSLSIGNFNLRIGANSNTDIPQGYVATVTGAITYEGGFTGTFNSTLEKVDGEWMIDSIYVTVPLNKVRP